MFIFRSFLWTTNISFPTINLRSFNSHNHIWLGFLVRIHSIKSLRRVEIVYSFEWCLIDGAVNFICTRFCSEAYITFEVCSLINYCCSSGSRIRWIIHARIEFYWKDIEYMQKYCMYVSKLVMCNWMRKEQWEVTSNCLRFWVV